MNEETLFEQARNLPLAERAAFLDRECAGEPEQRARVEALLAADAVSHSPLDRPVPPYEQTGKYTPEPDAPEATANGHEGRAGSVIAGRYTLVDLVGEGGMGSIWRAKQSEPVKRFVAVKLIKAGMDSKQVLARFEAERQALALMDHPSIAKVLDGGLHEERPFFVMELVKGTPITQFCDANKLRPQQRLELFIQACQAIQHAHQKGIIHRDIKPSNVLVALYDDRPVVKVIDFGVAKATGGTLSEATIDTGLGCVVGTPQYMSPEQATFNNLDIDTRSDVYALGVLLYELLTGSPPFSGAELKKMGFLEILRVVREEEPPRPSTKLSTADALPSLSANRGTEPKKLTGLLRNELDWIVMKALEKDRTRRYESANGLARDVQRYLADELVEARPPSAGYRLKKFVKRYKAQMIAASLVLLALVAGITGTTLGLLEARRQEQVALKAAEEERQAKHREAERADGERDAKEQAERNLAFAAKGNEILGSIFINLDPNRNYANVGEFSETLSDHLKKAVVEIEGSALGDPIVVARMQNTLGQSLLNLGDAKSALAVLEKARATLSDKLGSDHPDTLLATRNLALGYQYLGKKEQALALMEEGFKLVETKKSSWNQNTVLLMSNLASSYMEAGKPEKALPLFEEALKWQTTNYGPDHATTQTMNGGLGLCYLSLGKVSQAIPLLEATHEFMKDCFGPNHSDTILAYNNLGGAYREVGQFDNAVRILDEGFEHSTTRFGATHPRTLAIMRNLAEAHELAGNSGRAAKLKNELNNLLQGNPEPEKLGFTVNPQLVAAEERYKQKLGELGPKHIETLLARRDMAQINMGLNRIDDAEHLLPEILRGMMDRGPGDEILEFTMQMLCDCVEIRKHNAPESWATFHSMTLLGAALLDQKQYAEAEPLLVKGYEGMKVREMSIPPQAATRIPEALDRLIELYTATNKPEEAQKYREQRENYPASKEKK